MANKFLDFFRMSVPNVAQVPPEKVDKTYKRLRIQTFLAATFGYALYYVCRLSMGVMKQPLIDAGLLNATQLGIIGACLYWAYAIGKLINGFLADSANIKRFMAAESFDEKAAWGYVALGMKMPFEMTDMILREVEAMLSLGCYSPLLDPLWRAYRIQYNDMHSCPSTYCYSPNLRYNHFRRMIAYVTMRHIEAHPEDLQARLQYYFMVAHTNIVRFNPYPYGNSSAYEFMRLYWSQDIVDY